MDVASLSSVKVLSFNCWGMYYVASSRIKERLGPIAQELQNYDVVGLQEVWKREDFNFLMKELKHTLPYHHYFHSGVIGSGLCVFSRHPIMAAYTHSFSVCGSVRRLLDGELFSGKGVFMCRILTPSGPLAFYTTHLDGRHRESHIFEIYKFVEQTRGGDPVIITGDFNTESSSPCYDFLRSSLNLCDVFSDCPENTCDVSTNVFTQKKKYTRPKRIDYIFYSDTEARTLSMTLQGRSLALTGTIPGKDFSYSDHEGVEATFLLEPKLISVTLHPQRGLEDSLVRHFHRLTDKLHAMQAPVRISPKRIIQLWVVLGVVTILLAPFVEYLIHPFLAAHDLGWVLFLAMAVVGGLVIAVVAVTINYSRTNLALQANITEIQTLLKFSDFVKEQSA